MLAAQHGGVREEPLDAPAPVRRDAYGARRDVDRAADLHELKMSTDRVSRQRAGAVPAEEDHARYGFE